MDQEADREDPTVEVDRDGSYTESIREQLPFLTDTEPITGGIKAAPQDFRVEEISSAPPENPSGKNTIVLLTLTNWETNRAIKKISKKLGISRARIGFSGTKDKRAVTTQYISIKGANVDAERINDIKDMEAEETYHSNIHLKMGDHRGNRFTILVKGSAPGDVDRARATLEELQGAGGFPNYFGAQRFGTLRPVTHIVGKHITLGDLKQAVLTYVGNPFPEEPEEVRTARELASDPENFKEALKIFPTDYSFERSMLHHLSVNPGDYAGALDQLPKNLTLMFVHAYQGYLFNRILGERISRKIPFEPVIGDRILPVGRDGLPEHGDGIPVRESNLKKMKRKAAQGKAFISGLVVGTEAAFAEGPQGEIEREIIEDELGSLDNLTRFIIPEIPRLTTKGIRRELLCPVENASVEEQDGNVLLKFDLNKGCYATSLLREMFKK